MQKSITPGARADENRFRETLQQAVRDGDVQSLRTLFENQQAVPWWANSEKSLIETYCNALQTAVGDNDLKRAESLLSEWSADSKLPPPEAEHFNRPCSRSLAGILPEAVMIGNRSLVRLLISYGARASEALASRMTGPVSADDETFDGILQDLLDAGWELKDSAILVEAVTAYMPTSKRDQRLPPWLLNHGANPDLPNYVGTSPMLYVAGYGSLSTLRLLFDHGAKVDSNALFAIIRKKKSDDPERMPMVQFLLSKGADINLLHKRERRPSSSALTYSRVFRHTPLWEAVKAKDVEMVELLIRNGADVNLRILANDIEQPSPLEGMLASRCIELREIAMTINKGGRRSIRR